ncbi:alpha/beta hydrolase family protein [Mycobacteroides salmoniphilum]|uniref:alpha/beta hydrolase family protein n=1 Tax=Mycobacteroides salmoniphilum TaxID=404941 RepID=UPI00177E15CC|nr:alpha/beta fold hydrolase [Mycobacteroides salmoniphilum]
MGGRFNGDYLKLLLSAGYAVAATDYIGLGTPGDHTYMGAVDQGNAVADIIPAVRQISPQLSKNWFVIGHSQGGAAALSTTRAGINGELPSGLKAAIAIAPGNSIENVPGAIVDGTDTDPFAPALGLYVLIGAAAADQNIHPEQVLSPKGQKTMEDLRNNTCLTDLLNNMSNLPRADIYLHNPQTIAVLSPRLKKYGNPDNGPTNGPTLIITGDADTVVPTDLTLKLIDSLRQQGSEIDDLVLHGQDHIQPLYDSFCEQRQYLAAHDGPPAPQTCPKR